MSENIEVVSRADLYEIKRIGTSILDLFWSYERDRIPDPLFIDEIRKISRRLTDIADSIEMKSVKDR